MIHAELIDTTIYIGNFSIHEPVTALSDFAISILMLYFFYQLKKQSNDFIIKNWSWFFILLGISSFFGGCSHAFFKIHDGIAYKSVWLTMQIINGFALYFAQQATLNSLLKESRNARLWKLSYDIQLVLFIIATIYFQKYLVTIIDNALALIPIMIIHFILKPKQSYQKKIGYGILISFITAIVHGVKLSLHAYFNYNDISHIFIIMSLYLVFKGVKEKAIS